jgi:hypothetical protein
MDNTRADMVWVARGPGSRVELVVDVLRDFHVRLDEDPERSERRFKIYAYMRASRLVHSCSHGPPPHRIRVSVLPGGAFKHGSRSRETMERYCDQLQRMAEAARLGMILD